MHLHTILAVLALIPGVALAQESSPEDRLLSCLVEETLPTDPAIAEQGGFQFEYQSFRGATEDRRVCTVYRLRNTLDKPPTPFRWTLADDAIVEKARLGRCEDGDDACPWLTFVKYFAGDIDTNLSTLSYGLNADAFHEQATTYLNHASVASSDIAEESGVTASSVGTEIVGTFASEDGTLVDVHILVKSRFEPRQHEGVTLVYEVEDLSGGGALAEGALHVAWDALTAVEPVATLLAAAPSGAEANLSLDGVGTLERTRNALVISVPARAFVLDPSFEAHVRRTDDAEPLVTVDMAAYVPIPNAP